MEGLKQWAHTALALCGVRAASSKPSCYSCRHGRPVDGYWLWCERRHKSVIGIECRLFEHRSDPKGDR